MKAKFSNIDPSTIKKIRAGINGYAHKIDKIIPRNNGYEVIARPYKFFFDNNLNMRNVSFYCEHC